MLFKVIGGVLFGCLVAGMVISEHDRAHPPASQTDHAAAWTAYRTQHPHAVIDEITAIDDAHIFGAGVMRDPTSLHWSAERVVDLDPGVVCGQIAGRNAYGAMTRASFVFVEGDGGVHFVTSEQEGFNQADARYCGARPALNGEPPQ